MPLKETKKEGRRRTGGSSRQVAAGPCKNKAPRKEGFMDVKEGVASIALLPSGSLSGHFIHLPSSVCYGLHGTELECERECSRGEDYRLIELTITDFSSKKDRVVIVECRGQDAARFQNIDHVHGWDEDVVRLVEQERGKSKVWVTFECETLKAEKAAEDHIRKFMPRLGGLDAVVNIGPMSITGLDFSSEEDHAGLDFSSGGEAQCCGQHPTDEDPTLGFQF